MGILQTLIIVLFCIASALLVLFVMMQSGKGGGLNLVGGGNTGMQPQTMDTITKITWVTGVVFFVLAILAAIAFADAGPKDLDKTTTDDAELPLPSPSSSVPADTKDTQNGRDETAPTKSEGSATTEEPAPAKNAQ